MPRTDPHAPIATAPARERRPARRAGALASAAVATLLLAACTTDIQSQAGPSLTAAGPTTTSGPGPSPVAPTTDTAGVTVASDATPTDVVTGLEAPWSVVRLDSGSSFISLRDSGTVVELQADGSTRDVATIDGVVHRGEGGLLGLAVLGGSPSYLYAYTTTADDNRVVRAPITGEPGSYGLGAQEAVLTGIPKADNHDGGRLAFGPDGMLWITTGDASTTDNAQDPQSLGGKILRVTPTGEAASDNPTAGSPVYTLGHRNPQGIAFDANGGVWAAEFGQNTFDELNALERGGNYGWPIEEGPSTDADFRAPVLSWSTKTASPSGLTAIGSTLFMAGLGGKRLFEIQVPPNAEATPTELFTGGSSLGRIRDVLPGPDGTLWIVTNNTDGRGTPGAGDDRIVSVPLTALAPAS
ncbi:PQQ-dependent sugar dehydrogenase [Frigoribacterium sp. 2-23]|uniref:PQQ-dependent sugar dehydrogenase n=1 Tax=Frigoribacterium sp. 2-23 TaxID=3415006 RepID=UPI003C7056DA